ncbi:MAG: hypothetical protein SOX97_04325 [Sutterella sp.]|nr:hypothetical protein [Sutterella sp.]
MTPEAFLQTVLGLPRESLFLAGSVLVLVLLLTVLVLALRARSRRPENIGLRRIEADYGEAPAEERVEPGLPEPDWDPLEETEDRQKLTERIREPEVRTGIDEPPVQTERPAAQEPVRPTAPAPDSAVQAEKPAAPKFVRGTPPWRFLQTLPFAVQRGLTTAHVDMLGIGVEAVFFPPEAASAQSDPVRRLLPFLPDGEILYREADRKTFSMGSLYAQPDAVIEIETGLIALEYKSRGERDDNPADPASTLRPKDLLQTLIEAMVLSVSTGRPTAPVLRTHNAAYFLRPERRIMSLLADRIAAAEDFVSPYSPRRGISAADYAALCSVPAEMIFARPADALSLAGEAAHRELLG